MSFGAYWGDFPCSLDPRSPPRYVRARGLEPSVSSVSVPLDLFTEQLLPRLDPKRFTVTRDDQAPAVLATLRATTPQAFATLDVPPYKADLLLAQAPLDPALPSRVVRARGLYFVSARIVDPSEDPPLAEILLSDVRRWWDDHGEVTRDWNVRLPGGGFVAHTRRSDGTPRTLREIVAFLLSQLPGALPLTRWPDPARLPESVEVRCWGGSPKEALRALLGAYRLELDVGADLNARVFAAGEGTVGEVTDGQTGDNDQEHDTETGFGVWATEFTAGGIALSKRPAHEVPEEVLVVGDRTVRDVRVDYLTPVVTYPAFDVVTGSPFERTVEATPENLTAFVRRLLPGQVAFDPRVDTGIVALLSDASLGGQSRADRVQSASPQKVDQDSPTMSPTVRRIMGQLTPQLPAVPALGIDGFLEEERPALGPGGFVSPASAPDRVPLPGVPPQPVGFSGVTLDPHVWQRLPALEAQAWPLELLSVDEEQRESLKQLWRVYQVPTVLRRLLPLRARAEVDYRGNRCAISVEAFGFRQTRIRIQNPHAVTDVAPEALDKAKVIEGLRVRNDEIECLKGQIEALRLPTVKEVVDLYKRELEAARAKASGAKGLGAPGGNSSLDGIPVTLDAQVQLLLAPLFRGEDHNQDPSVMDTESALRRLAAHVVKQLLPQEIGASLADVLFGDAAATADQTEQKITERIKALEAERNKLEEALDPFLGAQRRLGDLEAAASLERSTTALSPATLEALLAARDEVEALTKKAAQDRAAKKTLPREDQHATREVVRFENLPRRSVAFKILDAERGLIELEELPCWVADQNAAALDQTWLIPMPVRVTFGTTNDHDASGVVDGVGDVPGVYMRALAEAVKAAPELRRLIGETGHVLPRAVGPDQARFSFTRADQESGQAEVGAHPWRVMIDDAARPFRRLVRLYGESNDAELLSRARAIAKAMLAAPSEAEAGTLTVIGPRSVVLNGRQTAVEVSTDGVNGFLTRVSFEADVAPLDEIVEQAERQRGPQRFVFGIDVEADRE